jgi:hypothetical protein
MSTSIYFPSNFGAMLTLEVASIRHYLGVKASKSEYPSNSKVSIFALSIFVVYALFYFSYVAIISYLNIPYSFIVEYCVRPESESRPLANFVTLPFAFPNLFNIVSLIIDLSLICLLRKNTAVDHLSGKYFTAHPIFKCSSIILLSYTLFFVLAGRKYFYHHKS